MKYFEGIWWEWRQLEGFFPHPCKWQELSCNRQEESADDQREELQMWAV
jgi:hypothetical protein